MSELHKATRIAAPDLQQGATEREAGLENLQQILHTFHERDAYRILTLHLSTCARRWDS